jgi:SMODS and SLOG-associating 2TM effector domain
LTLVQQTALATTVLGALTTVVASYLARTRGSNEPELSITRVKDLEKFIRELEAYMLDFGQLTGDDHDAKIIAFRTSFEEILGNNAEG